MLPDRSTATDLVFSVPDGATGFSFHVEMLKEDHADVYIKFYSGEIQLQPHNGQKVPWDEERAS